MKKFALFCAVAMALSTFTVGCSSDGSSSFCRTGSLWPTARNRQNHEVVYTSQGTYAGQCDPCEVVSSCNPCEPIGPCDMTCSGGVISGGILPGPGN